MIRVLDTVERNVVDSMLQPIVVANSVSTEVIPDSTKSGSDEIAYIELFNAGVNNAYYAFGRPCDNNKNYNAFIAPGGQLTVKVRQAVNIYSVGGTIISRTILRRIQFEG